MKTKHLTKGIETFCSDNSIYLVLPLSEVPNSGGAEVHLSALIIVLGQ